MISILYLKEMQIDKNLAEDDGIGFSFSKPMDFGSIKNGISFEEFELKYRNQKQNPSLFAVNRFHFIPVNSTYKNCLYPYNNQRI